MFRQVSDSSTRTAGGGNRPLRIGFQEADFAMFKTDNKMLAAFSALALMIGVAAPAASFAQDASGGAAPAAAANDNPGAPRLGWYKTCNKQGDNDICFVQNVLLANGGQLVTAIGLIS